METIVRLLLIPSHAVVPKPKYFSGLCRLKTYLRNSVSQARLKHLAILHVHQEMTDRIDWIEQGLTSDGLDVLSVAKNFVEKSDSRMFTFGHINRADSCSVFESFS